MAETGMDLGYVARVRKIAETTVHGKRAIVQELLPWFGDFKGMHVIQAKEAKTNRLAAYVGFEEMHNLADARPDCLELRQIKVFPEYRKSGVGDSLLGLVNHLAAKANVPLILEPKPTSEKPMGKERLTEWYQKHGYRKLTPEEVERYAHLDLMHTIDSNLLFKGFEFSTGKLTGKRRYSIGPEEIERIKTIPEDIRIGLYRQSCIEQHGTDRAFEANRSTSRSLVSKYLIREPTSVDPRLLRGFRFAPKYRFPNRERLRQAWGRIHKAGKQPRKQPKVVPRVHI